MPILEFHDSYIRTIDPQRGEVLLDAVIYAEEYACETQQARVRLLIPGLRIEGAFDPVPFDIYRDNIEFNGVEYNGLFPIPNSFTGEVQLLLSRREDGSELR